MGVGTFEYRKFFVLVILIMILIQKYQLRYINRFEREKSSEKNLKDKTGRFIILSIC